jgi:predicted metal-dependent hydrolase
VHPELCSHFVQDQEYESAYLRFFECFNQQRFFEAHEALEALWLPQRQGPEGRFYKGLIQLAGAFVHLQKARVAPAKRLFELARENLRGYPASHEGLAVEAVLGLINEWLGKLESGTSETAVLTPTAAPQLRLQPASGGIVRNEERE